jgi:probable rRNA maturation factor
MNAAIARRKPSVRVEVLIDEPLWRKEGSRFPVQLRRAAAIAMSQADRERLARATGEAYAKAEAMPASQSLLPHARFSLSILLAGDARLEALNGRFRGKNKPTNVLAFPAPGGCAAGYLGDVAIAYGVAAREAAEAGKTFRDHALHLAVHGVLHLLGYDHETAREAHIMEPLEITVLAEFGIADPYAGPCVVAATAD